MMSWKLYIIHMTAFVFGFLKPERIETTLLMQLSVWKKMTGKIIFNRIMDNKYIKPDKNRDNIF